MNITEQLVSLIVITAFTVVDAIGAQVPLTGSKKPNVLYFLVDNLGMGELSSYNGGGFRGVATARINDFAK